MDLAVAAWKMRLVQRNNKEIVLWKSNNTCYMSSEKREIHQGEKEYRGIFK